MSISISDILEAVDTDQSGSIDKKELQIALSKIAREAGIPELTSEQVAEAMEALDTDGSGTIEIDEFKELVRQLLEAVNSKEPSE